MPTKIIIRKKKRTGQLFREKTKNLDLKMVRIPAGTFVMGTPDEEIERLYKEYNDDYFRRERPQHVVSVPEFCLSQTPITQAQWRIVAKFDLVEHTLNPEPSQFKGDDRPVENVTWLDVKEFCARLRQQTGKDYRLPSEAEWEYACRGMIRENSSTNNKAEIIADWNKQYHQPFYCGETITTDLANYRGKDEERLGWPGNYGRGPKGEYREETTPVGSFPANHFGLYDMHGNVWEWCEDDYHNNYKGAPTDGSVWLDKTSNNITKILRGGSWYFNPWDCRSASRFYGGRDVGDINFGFRVACSPPDAP